MKNIEIYKRIIFVLITGFLVIGSGSVYAADCSNPAALGQQAYDNCVASKRSEVIANGYCNVGTASDQSNCMMQELAKACSRARLDAVTACPTLVPQPPAAKPIPPSANIADPNDPASGLGGCGTNDGRCWDSNPCTIDRCVNGVCKYTYQSSGYVCQYDRETESTPVLACNSGGSCSVSVYRPPAPVVQQPAPNPVTIPVIVPQPNPAQSAQWAPNVPADETPTVPATTDPPATPVAPASQQPPSNPPNRSVIATPSYIRVPSQTPARNATPAIVCDFNGTKYFPSQKRYECSEPRTRSSCWEGAGSGVPYICSADGSWEAGNDGLNECSDECGPTDPQAEGCAEGAFTCTYSDESGQCYGGTGTVGFNEPGCNYSCGPVTCPVISGSSIVTDPENVPVEQVESPSEEYCWGEMYSSCGGDSTLLMTSWAVSEKMGQGSCNIFVRDGSGDHFLSNECVGSWSGTSLDSIGVDPNGYYELYVSNGTDGCYNRQVAYTQISCQAVAAEIVAPPPPTDDQSPVDDVIDLVTEWIE